MQRFLDRFQYETITLQYVNKATKEGNKVEVLTPAQYAANLHTYKKLNKEGYEFFFMVNEGDGVTIPKGLHTARNQEAVEQGRLTALFIDADGCPAVKINAFLKRKGLRPHFVVESSPQKYHYYFLLQYTKPDPLNLSRWKACQRALMYLGNPDRPDTGCDPMMSDHSRILRIPGFNHLKNPKKPFLTSIIDEYDHPFYDIAEISEILEAHMFTRRDYQSYELPQGKVSSGSRHAEMISYFGHMINKDISPEVTLNSWYGMAKMNYEEPEDFLPGGKRNKEVVDALNYVVNSTQREQLNQTLLVFKNKQSSDDPFALDEDFYRSAPGIAGEIVNEILNRAHYRCPSVTFSTAIGLLGSLKSHHTNHRGLTPSNYFLCFEASGMGKDYPQAVIANTIAHLGIDNMLANEVRSAQGLYSSIKTAGGRALLMIDEMQDFFAAITRKTNAGHWLTQCEGLLLKMYTNTGRAIVKTGDLAKEKGDTFSYPCLNMTACGVPISFKDSFTLESLDRGLLSRFMIVTSSNKYRQQNKNSKAATYLNGNIEAYLRTQHIAMSDYFNEVRSELDEPLKLVPYEDGVFEKHDKFRDELDYKYNQLTDQGEHQLKILYTRAGEQVMRLALAIAEDVITHEVYDFCVKFVTSRIEASMSLIGKTFKQSQLAEDIDYLVEKIQQFQSKHGRPMRYRDIVRSTKYRNAHEAKQIIKAAQEGQFIKEVTYEIKKQKVNGFILDEVL